MLVVTATFLINTKQSKARIKITLNPLPLYEYIKLSMERMSSLSDTCRNTTNSKINRHKRNITDILVFFFFLYYNRQIWLFSFTAIIIQITLPIDEKNGSSWVNRVISDQQKQKLWIEIQWSFKLLVRNSWVFFYIFSYGHTLNMSLSGATLNFSVKQNFVAS